MLSTGPASTGCFLLNLIELVQNKRKNTCSKYTITIYKGDPAFVGLTKYISQSPTNMSTTYEYGRADWLIALLLTSGVGESLSYFSNLRMQGRTFCFIPR